MDTVKKTPKLRVLEIAFLSTVLLSCSGNPNTQNASSETQAADKPNSGSEQSVEVVEHDSFRLSVRASLVHATRVSNANNVSVLFAGSRVSQRDLRLFYSGQLIDTAHRVTACS